MKLKKISWIFDDNLMIIKKGTTDKNKIYILSDYKCDYNTTGSSIYHVKITVSDLKMKILPKLLMSIKTINPM